MKQFAIIFYSLTWLDFNRIKVNVLLIIVIIMRSSLCAGIVWLKRKIFLKFCIFFIQLIIKLNLIWNYYIITCLMSPCFDHPDLNWIVHLLEVPLACFMIIFFFLIFKVNDIQKMMRGNNVMKPLKTVLIKKIFL